jgi:hypothetical protein
MKRRGGSPGKASRRMAKCPCGGRGGRVVPGALAAMLVCSACSSEGLSRGPEEGNGPFAAVASSVPPSPSHKLDGNDANVLIRLLARARRIDPEGQPLLRRAAFLRVAIARTRIRLAELEAHAGVKRAVALVARPEVQRRLVEIRKLGGARMVESYRRFLEDHQLDDYTMDLASERQHLDRQLRSCNEELADVARRLDRLEHEAPISTAALDWERNPKWQLPLPPRRPAAARPQPAIDPATGRQLKRLLQHLTEEAKP